MLDFPKIEDEFRFKLPTPPSFREPQKPRLRITVRLDELRATAARPGPSISRDPSIVRGQLQLQPLRQLKDNWDDEGAPAPNTLSIGNASLVLAWLEQKRLALSESVDADVLGGVAIWLQSPGGVSIWISCMNTGTNAVTFSNNGQVSSEAWSDRAKEKLVSLFESPK